MKPLSLILLCGLLGIPWSVFAQDATTGTLRGTVSDTSTTQTPIEGVRLVIVDPASNEYETVTDSNGEYAITGLSPGRYLMSFYKDGYGAREGNRLTIIAGGTVYMPVKITKSEPPWLLLICLGGAAILICGLVIAVGFRIDRTSS